MLPFGAAGRVPRGGGGVGREANVSLSEHRQWKTKRSREALPMPKAYVVTSYHSISLNKKNA